MSNTLQAAALFLINTLFDLYLFILVIRIILVYVGANYFDPITQFIVKFTDFVVKPLRRFLPNIKRFELSSVVLLLVLQLIKFVIITNLAIGMPSITSLVLLAVGDTLKLIIQTFFYAILLQVILSWVQPYSPVSRVLNQFTSPIMNPLHRIIPTVGGMDITPIPALILLQLLNIIIVNPIMSLGLGVALA